MGGGPNFLRLLGVFLCAFAPVREKTAFVLRDLNSLSSTALQPFARYDRPFVPASTNLTARISGTDFKNKKLTFATGVPCSCCYLCAGRCGRGMSDIDSYTNRQLTWSKQEFQHPRCRNFH